MIVYDFIVILCILRLISIKSMCCCDCMISECMHELFNIVRFKILSSIGQVMITWEKKKNRHESVLRKFIGFQTIINLLTQNSRRPGCKKFIGATHYCLSRCYVVSNMICITAVSNSIAINSM